MFRTLLLFLIRFYQNIISPFLPPRCRFYPTCSHYAVEALETYGFWHGLRLTLLRIIRCHPFCRGGYDPLPSTLNRGFHGK
ncbi:MAG: membrane protein insertion efficiency factor YidD [Desulfuromonas sp.]|nr:MAG: membrane protein insertion efficiency factor YidD [Desulfuromonas sp.]